MLPHPETAVTIAELRYQEWLRDVAQQRIGARAEAGSRPRPAISCPARSRTASWLTGWVTRMHRAKSPFGRPVQHPT